MAISRLTKFLYQNNFLRGNILDYGGAGEDVEKLRLLHFRAYGHPMEIIGESFGTIICNHILDDLDEDGRSRVIMDVSSRLAKTGFAFFAVDPNKVSLPFDSVYRDDENEIYVVRYSQLLSRENEYTCPFCQLTSKVEEICESLYFIAFYDANPVCAGHALIVSRRHFLLMDEMTQEEWREFRLIVGFVKAKVREKFGADGFNVGINEGSAAGQKVKHFAVHVIPRRVGDVENPLGGVRGVLGRG